MSNTRLHYNLEILKILEKFLKENPEQRFGQALRNLNIIKDTEPFEFGYLDRFIIAEEPSETLKGMVKYK